MHELAHLTAWNKYRNKILPHGREWKSEFRIHLKPFTEMNIFPQEVCDCLNSYIENPKASSCTDVKLLKALKKFDRSSEYVHLDDIPEKSIFSLRNGREFIKGEKVRKRFKCRDIKSGRFYLVSPVAEVIRLTLF